ncbi:hypothetical protein, partial [uncultured Selenomonas sp.]|uniref:hypothetical protein n=1 Tax=uncultured Selenomonas sp. TaxID=159275 RepID=UPI0025FAC15D
STSFKTLRTMNALPDYLTKSGWEESGVLLGAYEENHLSSVRMLDIGGGFKTAEEYWTYEDYAAEIFRALHFEKRPSIELMVEPGNSLVRNCCTYRMTVIDVFSLGLRNYVVVDGSSLHLYGPNRQTGCCCEVQYRIMSRKERCILEEQIVVGNTCRETDVILSLHKRPQFFVGDEIVLHDVGAYTLSRISDFLLAKPAIYVKPS